VARVLRLPLLAILVFLVLAAPAGAADRLLASPDRCGPQTDRGATPRAQEHAMRCMVNFARRAAGLSALRVGPGRLTTSADRKAADILRCGDFSHTACGREFTFHMKVHGCFGAGENIAWGSGSLGTVRSIMRSWLHSAGHRANLLNPRFREHGVALRTGSIGGQANAAVWVHQFGFRC
jgi:uncharacterized protein YkwD